MSLIVTVTQLSEGRSGSLTQDWLRKYTVVYQVMTTDPHVGIIAARTAVDPNSGLKIPSIGNSYSWLPGTPYAEADVGAFVQSITPVVDDVLRTQWKVTVDYGPYDGTTFGANPLEWPLRIQWGGADYERVLYADINGKAIVNSAGDPFNDPITIDDSRPVLEVTMNLADYDGTTSDLYRDKVNSDTFLGVAPGLVKVSTTPAVLKQSPDSGFYFEVTYKFHFNRDGWKRNILDQGFNYLDKTKSPAVSTPVTVTGQSTGEPVLLDGSGGKLAANGTPVFIPFEVYGELDFGSTFGFNFATAPGMNSSGGGGS